MKKEQNRDTCENGQPMAMCARPMSQQEQLIRSFVTIEALRQDLDAMRSISDNRVEQIALLRLAMDDQSREFSEFRNDILATIRSVQSAYGITMDGQTGREAIIELAQRTYQAEGALRILLDIVRELNKPSNWIGSPFSPQNIRDIQPTIGSVIEALYTAMMVADNNESLNSIRDTLCTPSPSAPN